MSLLSRNTGGKRRRAASMAVVFAGTLLTYLVVTAVPAFAQTTCAAGAAAGQVVLNVGTDDVLVLASDGTEIEVSENGAALASCTGVPITIATTDWLQILGSNAGNEIVSIYDQEDGDWGAFTTTFDGGNGSDTLIFENGPVAALALPDAGSFFIGLRQAGAAIAVDVTGAATSAEMRIDNAETIRVNGSAGDDGLCASRTIAFGAACDVDLTTQANNIGGGVTGDDIVVPATAPVTQGLVLSGAAGLDVLASGNGNDTFLGGPGSDAVSYEASGSAVTVDLALGTGTGMGTDTLTDVQDVWGSLFGDTLLGNSLDNNIFGDEGNDTIDGREGNDGGTAGAIGVDGLSGGDDDDTLTGGTGNDDVDGNADDDVINEGAASSGTDDLHGGPGGGCDQLNYGLRTVATTINETTGTGWGAALELDTGGGFEILVTGSADDTIIGDSSHEIARPGAGNDTVDLNGDTGNPCAPSFPAGDYLDLSGVAGPATFNLITGTATGDGTDTFTDLEGYVGTAGADSVVVGDTAANGNTLGDFISGAGIDTVDATANTLGITINLSVFGNGQEVENAFGGSGNDILTGNVLNNRLIGNDGFDTIAAGTGNDFVEGGQGNDTLSDGGGADRLSYRNAPSGVTVDLANGFASGGDGEDTIVGGFEIVLGSNFNDNITAGQTAFDVPFTLKGFKGNDSLIGSNSTDTLKGGAGNDELRAGAGDDLLSGANGNDLLLAGSGDDRLKGGKGSDRGIGGRGFDVCRSIEQKSGCEA